MGALHIHSSTQEIYVTACPKKEFFINFHNRCFQKMLHNYFSRQAEKVSNALHIVKNLIRYVIAKMSFF